MSKSRHKGSKKRSKPSRSPRTQTPPASTKSKSGKKASFDYRSSGGICLRPHVSLSLIAPNGNIVSPKAVGLVDSGADTCTFPASWAEVLGIDIDEDCLRYESDTAGGVAVQRLYEPGIHATFLGEKLHLGATFSEACGTILLGRMDFFRYCSEIRFDQPAEAFHVELVGALDEARQSVGQTLAAQAAAIKQWQTEQAAVIAPP